MQFTVVFVGLLGIFGTAYASVIQERQLQLNENGYEQRIFETIINNTITKAANFLRLFDPIELEEYNGNTIFHQLEIKNVYFGGFSNFYAPRIYFGGSYQWQFDIELIAPKLKNEIESYKVTGPVFFGEGSVRINLQGTKTKLNVKFSLGINPNPSISFSVTHKKVDVAIVGVYNDPDLSRDVTSLINDILTGSTNSLIEVFSRLMSIMKKIISHIINGSH